MMISIPNSSKPSTGQWTQRLGSIGRLAAFFAVLFFVSTAAFAQLSTADIVGTVTDPTGALVPNAKVTLQNVETHEQRNGTTNDTGGYVFTQLPVGRYSVTVHASGFKTTVANLAVEAGDRAHANVQLATGVENDTVTVNATTPLLQADNATVSSTITSQSVQDLPLNGRNFVSLVQLVPGANAGPGNGLTSGARPDDRRATASFSVNGQDDTLNNYIIDGADDNERVIGTIGVRPNIEGIQEITVQTNSYSVEAGRTAGGVVNITTKSGTNQFHGSVYEYFRNDILNARNVLQTTGRRPELRQNQFGGSIGGPIIKDKTFFFADYEGFRQVEGVTYTSTVPTLAQYNDINSIGAGSSPQALIGQSTDGVAGYCTGKANCIDPIALNYLKLFPAPTAPGITNNFVTSPNRTQYSTTVDAKIDHDFNPNNHLFGRFTYNKVDTFTPQALGTQNGLQISGGRYIFAGPATDKAYQYALGYTHIFNQSLLLDLRATYTRINNLSLPLNYGLNADTTVGFGNNMNFNALSNFLTPIQFGGFNDIGDGAYVPLQDIDNSFQYSGVVTKTIGNHSVKVGLGLIRRQARNVQSAFAAGQYGFGLQNDSCNGPYTLQTNGSYACSAANAATPAQQDLNQIASSLTGAFTSESRNYDLAVPDYRSWEPSAFALDSWRVTPKLTVQYGLRYDIFTPFTEAHSHISNFDFFKALNSTSANVASALEVANVNGVSSTAGIKTDYRDLAPRVGFAYSITPTLVLRGGYGLSFFPGNYTSNADLKNAPFVSVYSPVCSQSDAALQIETANGVQQSSIPAKCFTAANDSTHTFDAGLPLPAPQSITSNALSFDAESPNFRSALIQQFNLQVEQQFGANVFTLGYVGNIGQHLPETVNNINSAFPFDPSNPNNPPGTGNLQLANALPNLGGVSWLQSEGISNYNGLQVSFQRRFVHGLAFDANYTWAKALSDITGFSEEGQQGWSNADPRHIRQIDYGTADNDIANRFVLSADYVLAYGADATGLKAIAEKGWEFNTIASWQTGKPFSITNGGGSYDGPYGNRATPFNNGGNDRPNKVNNLANPHKLSEWFNTANYAPQPLGTIGTAQRNSEFGPHFRDIDFSLIKTLPVTERFNVEFRAETFNITNTPSFYMPNANIGNYQLGNASFGQITNYDPNYNPREIQFAAKLLF